MRWDGAPRNQERDVSGARGHRPKRGRLGRGGTWQPRLGRTLSVRNLAAGELFHHESGAAARDMGDDRRAAMDFRDQP